jgi:modulator of FtsH protease HflC
VIERSRDLDRWSRVRRVAWIAALGVVVTLGKLCLFTVDRAEYVIVTDFGKPTQVITTPGLHVKYPYQSLRTFDNRLFVYSSPASEFLTLEKTPVVAAGTVLWRVGDPRKFFETVFDKAGAESRLGDIVFAELGAALGRNSLTAFVSVEAAAYRAEAIVAEIAQRCRAVAMMDYGIEVVDVQLRGFDFPKQNRLRLYARMKSERGRISMQYRSEGEEAGLKVRAAAEEEKAGILGKAVEASQQSRGEGDAEAARLYGEALTQAPDFYAFLRAMESSRSLAGKGTTMVLPADSPLFGVLFDSNYFNEKGAEDNGGNHGKASHK